MRNKFLGTGEPGCHPVRKLRVILSGLRFAVLHDMSVAWKVALSAVILLVSLLFEGWVDFLLIMVATGQMLMAEIFNTAIEAMCDFLKTEEDFRIGVIKDMAAAAAGISIFFWLLVVGLEAFNTWRFMFG